MTPTGASRRFGIRGPAGTAAGEELPVLVLALEPEAAILIDTPEGGGDRS